MPDTATGLAVTGLAGTWLAVIWVAAISSKIQIKSVGHR